MGFLKNIKKKVNKTVDNVDKGVDKYVVPAANTVASGVTSAATTVGNALEPSIEFMDQLFNNDISKMVDQMDCVMEAINLVPVENSINSINSFNWNTTIAPYINELYGKNIFDLQYIRTARASNFTGTIGRITNKASNSYNYITSPRFQNWLREIDIQTNAQMSNIPYHLRWFHDGNSKVFAMAHIKIRTNSTFNSFDSIVVFMDKPMSGEMAHNRFLNTISQITIVSSQITYPVDVILDETVGPDGPPDLFGNKVVSDTPIFSINSSEDDEDIVTTCVESPPTLDWKDKPIDTLFEPNSNKNVPSILKQIVDTTIQKIRPILRKQTRISMIVDNGVKKIAVIKSVNNFSTNNRSVVNENINFVHKIIDLSLPLAINNIDTTMKGNLNIVGKKNNLTMSSNPSSGVTCFFEKVGINQPENEVNAVLHIDTKTQETVTTINTIIKQSLLETYQQINSTQYNFPLFKCNITKVYKNITIDMLNNRKGFALKPRSISILQTIVHQLSLYEILYNEQKFSFVEILEDKNTKYLAVMTGIISITNNVKYITLYPVLTPISKYLNDESYAKQFSKLIERYSLCMRSMNHAVSLLQTPNIQNELLIGNNMLFTEAIDNFDTTIERCGDFFGIFNNNNQELNTFLFNEKTPSWYNENINTLFEGENKIGPVINNMLTLYKQTYGPLTSHITLNDYQTLEGLKVTFLYELTLNIENTLKTCMIGIDLSICDILLPGIRCHGDTNIEGTFNVKNDNQDLIFSVNNGSKTTTSMYNMGIGTPSPKSCLDIKDHSIQDIVNLVDDTSRTDYYTNELIKQLKVVNMNTPNVVETIINNVGLTQTPEKYYCLFEIPNTNKYDIVFRYMWLFQEWKNKKLSELLIDKTQYNNMNLLTKIKKVIVQLLESCLFNGSKHVFDYLWIYGMKRSECTIFQNNNKLFGLITGQNVQSYKLKVNSSAAVNTYFKCETSYNTYLQSIYLKNNTPSSIVNKEVLTNLIPILQETFPMTTYKVYNMITNTVKEYNFTTHNLISTININSLTNMDEKTTLLSYQFNLLKFYSTLDNGYGKCQFESPYNNYVSQFFKQGDNIYSVEFMIEQYINPALHVEGDVKIEGSLSLVNENLKNQFTTIDPNRKYVGINTDDRFIYYNTPYTTTNAQGAQLAQHHVCIKNDSYPNIVCERIADNPDSSVGSYTSFSASTMKRHTNKNNFTTIYENTPKNNVSGISPNSVGNNMYGVDISFEMSDTSKVTQELGNIIMGIDDMDNGRIKAGFAVRVNDEGLIPRNILHVDNTGCLSSNSIKTNEFKLNGYKITVNNGELVIVKEE
jgi:hypothetical protein